MKPTFHRMSASGNAFYLSLDLDPRQAPRFARLLEGDSDGLILGSASPASMRMFNPDGSEAMCGNGLRCLARFLADRNTFESGSQILTLDGPKRVRIDEDFVEAEMGPARAQPGFGTAPGELAELEIDGETFRGYAVFVGNPHWVLPEDEKFLSRIAELGPRFETHERFPDGVNTEFVYSDATGLRVRVWERGVGETLSCGTGALAVAAAGPDPIAPGQLRRIRYPGGVLRVRSDAEGILHLGGEVVREGVFQWREGEGLFPADRERKNDSTG